MPTKPLLFSSASLVTIFRSDPHHPLVDQTLKRLGKSLFTGHCVLIAILMLLNMVTHHDAMALNRVAHVGASINCVAPAGDFVYIGEGASLRVLNVVDPGNPMPMGKIDLAGYCADAEHIGDYVLCALLDQGMQVVDISDPSSPIVVDSFPVSKYVDGGVWWNCIHVSGNRAYFGSGNGGSQSGIHIFDITNPSNPRLLGHFEETLSYPTGLAVHGNYLYVAYRELPGIQILDISDPESIFEAGYYQVGTSETQIEDILIDGNLAYLSASFKVGVTILDLTDPLNPVRHGTLNTPNVAIGAVKMGDYLYVADTWDKPGVITVNVSNPDNPLKTNGLNLDGCSAGKIDIDGQLLYIPAYDEMRIFSLSEPDSPSLIGVYNSPEPMGHGYGIEVVGQYAYVCDYRAGIRIFDVFNPAAPIFLSQIRTTAEAVDVEVVGNTAYVSNNWGRSMDVLDIADKYNPTHVHTINFPVPGRIRCAIAAGEYLYVAGDEAGFYILNISNRKSPTIIRQVNTDGNTEDIAISGQRLLVADGFGGFKIYSISNPSNPSLLASIPISGNTQSVAADGNHVVLGIIGPPNWDIRTYDISVPSNPELRGSAYAWHAIEVEINGNRAYAQSHTAGVWAYDISNFATPVIIDKFDTEAWANRGLDFSGGYLYSTDGSGGFNVFSTGFSSVNEWKGY